MWLSGLSALLVQFGKTHWIISLLTLAFFLAGCASAPLGADRMTPRMAYRQVEKTVLSSGKLSAYTTSVLLRHDLSHMIADDPAAALVQVHQKALATGERDLLFALAELSYYTGEQVRKSIKPWEPRDARDYYLGAVVYAYLYLFGDAKGNNPGAFHRRFRAACDLYNYGLGWALTERRSTNAVARLEGGLRRLPVGEIELRLDQSNFATTLSDVDQFFVADQFRVRGFGMRNREGGIGTPLIAVGAEDLNLQLRRSAPATVFLRLPESLTEIAAGNATGTLELYSTFGDATVTIGGTVVPLEADFTAASAYTLNQSFAWRVERLQFFSASKALPSQVILSEPYQPGSVPVVFVHGTFSSPVWWGEMLNTLNADPVLRRRCQIWLFLYSSSKPLVVSANDLRDELAATIQRLDPEGKDLALRQMVVIGHSQGGLLTKLTATDTGDKLWRVFSEKPLVELDLTEEKRSEIRRLAFYEPLAFVRRVVFISTPHRGSYMARGFVRNLTRKLVSLPESLVQNTYALLTQIKDIKLPKMFQGKMPTSVDGMSPDNPLLLTLAEIPVASGIKAHSIIPVKGGGDYREGRDGVVTYQSAHVDYVESELIVRGHHSCQSMPPTIEEVRRILHEHLRGLDSAQDAGHNQTAPDPINRGRRHGFPL